MTERLLTPTKITAWLDCAHFLNLRHQVDRGALAVAPPGFGSLASLLVAKGREHEADCLAEYRSRGLDVLEIPGRDRGESFSHWAARIGNPLASEHDVIYQMPLIHDGIRGIADFLLRVEDSGAESWGWEPVDAKLARSEAKPGHVLQLCFYAEAIESLTGRAPERMHLWLGSGETETLVTEEFRPYWRRLRRQLTSLLDDDAEDPETAPEPCAHCAFCEFQETCTKEWRYNDSLIYVAGLRGADRARLEEAGVDTLGQLAALQDPVDGLAPEPRGPAGPTGFTPGTGPAGPGRAAAGGEHRTGRRTPPGATASNSCPPPMRATSSSTSRVTPSGGPMRGCSSCSVSSPVPRRAPGTTGPSGPTTTTRKGWPPAL